MNGGYCSLGLFEGEPSKEDCLGCDSYDGMSRGLGDDIAKIAKATRLDAYGASFKRVFKRDCGCKKRQKKWNELFPHESED
jgi:hypothetical protein